MIFEICSPVFGNTLAPDIHIAVNELKKIKKDQNQYTDFSCLLEMLSSLLKLRNVINIKPEKIYDYIAEATSQKAEFVVAVNAKDIWPGTQFLISYYLVDNNKPKILEAFIYE